MTKKQKRITWAVLAVAFLISEWGEFTAYGVIKKNRY
jgi:hypothetical protein